MYSTVKVATSLNSIGGQYPDSHANTEGGHQLISLTGSTVEAPHGEFSRQLQDLKTFESTEAHGFFSCSVDNAPSDVHRSVPLPEFYSSHT